MSTKTSSPSEQEKNIYKKIAKNKKLPFISLIGKKISIGQEHIPYALAEAKKAVIFHKTRHGAKLALSDPQDTETVKIMKKILKLPVKVHMTTPTDIRYALDTAYETKEKDDLWQKILLSENKIRRGEVPKKTPPPVSEKIDISRENNKLLLEMFLSCAPEIHIAPKENIFSITIPHKKKWVEVGKLDREAAHEIFTSLKKLAHLQPEEHRLVQKGWIRFNRKNDHIIYSLTVTPGLHGEKFLLTLLTERDGDIDLDDLGMQLGTQHLVQQALDSRHGIIFVNGETNSGKTTTLYTLLKKAAHDTVSACSIEKKVERHLPNTAQTEVTEKNQVSFSDHVRCVLKQDADVVMVGEINDHKTLESCIDLAHAGKLVMAAINGNTTKKLLAKLIGSGEDRSLIAANTRLILTQKLVKKLCPYCAEIYEIDKKDEDRIKTIAPEKDITHLIYRESGVKLKKIRDLMLYRARGCTWCEYEGYAGKIAIFEAVPITTQLATAVGQGQTKKIDAALKNATPVPQAIDGFIKALQGLTTLQEILPE